MKSKYLTLAVLIIFLVINNHAKAQCHFQPWFTDGNTIGTGPHLLGTLDANDITLTGNATQIGVITGNATPGNLGNVEIGITGTLPQNKLLVEEGTIYSSLYTLLGTTITTGGGSIPPSWNDIGLLSVANNTTDLNSQAIAAFVDQSNGSNNGGVAAVVHGDNNMGNNIGNMGFVTLTYGDNSSNQGFAAAITNTLNGGTNGSQNAGYSAFINGNNGGNVGFQAQISGNNSSNFGVQVVVGTTITNTNPIVGVYGGLSGGGDGGGGNYGVEGDLSNGAPAPGNVIPYYAIYGLAPTGTATTGNTTLVSGGNSLNCYAGYFDGDVFSTGTYYYPSDPKLKENFNDFQGALYKLNKLNIKTYTFKQKDFPTMNFPQGEQVGLLADNLKEVFPTLVKHTVQPAIKGKGDAVDFDAVNYNALIPVLVQAVKELDAKTSAATSPTTQAQIETLTTQVNDQSKQITDLTNLLNDICNLGCPGLQNGRGNNQDVVLFQSIPNPTSGSATIGYVINIPYNHAFITVTTAEGMTVKQLPITLPGKGSVQLEGNQLASGTFRYSLYIDDKLYDTKTIVITQK